MPHDLSDWALRHNITHKVIDNLLKLLTNNFPDCELPRSARTLLGTTRSTTKITTIQGGDYLHIGLEPALNSLVDAYSHVNPEINNISLSLNVDSLPLSRSSTKCFWPILISDDVMKSI